MESLEIAVSKREASGKGGARRVRLAGRVPGILYSKRENLILDVELAALNRLLRRVSAGNALLDVAVEGRTGEKMKALIKEIQRDPVTGQPVHFDLLHIDMDQKVRVQVPVHLHGTPVGVKRGGVLEEFIRDLEVECLARDIPASIDIDVSELMPNDAIHVRDVARPGLLFLTAPELVIVHVIAKKAEADEAPAEGAAPAGEAAPPAEGGEGN